jgi:hypothetical protein
VNRTEIGRGRRTCRKYGLDGGELARGGELQTSRMEEGVLGGGGDFFARRERLETPSLISDIHQAAPALLPLSLARFFLMPVPYRTYEEFRQATERLVAKYAARADGDGTMGPAETSAGWEWCSVRVRPRLHSSSSKVDRLESLSRLSAW